MVEREDTSLSCRVPVKMNSERLRRSFGTLLAAPSYLFLLGLMVKFGGFWLQGPPSLSTWCKQSLAAEVDALVHPQPPCFRFLCHVWVFGSRPVAEE